MNLSDKTIAVVGLGYVGLPLAAEFGKKRRVIGFDIRSQRITELQAGYDSTGEVEPDDLKAAAHLCYTDNADDLRECGVFIVSVPTPIDHAKQPDLSMLQKASRTVAEIMGKGAVIVYESTVYPGCTREVCIPILEQVSGLKFNEDFFVGYSPERINPGDREHRISNIVKVTSGSTPEAAAAIDDLYGAIITAGTHKASSIEIAEAAKVIENTQRDLNIALMNELSIIFNKLGIDTQEILKAASTKWNFINFTPGLVGGHCIGVDPYYLTHRAQKAGYHPEVILAGRRINDAMGRYVADRVARLMMLGGLPVVGSRILVMGVTFKENCPDMRNSRVSDVIGALTEYNAQIDAWDPWVDPGQVEDGFTANLLSTEPSEGVYDAIILAVGHRAFAELGPTKIRKYGKMGSVFFDVKSVFSQEDSDGRL